MLVISVAVLMVVALGVRIVPLLLAPHGAGVDQWFWKAYIETMRRDPEFPPRLPQFLLDQEQWYPPLFPWVMARLPKAVFERHATFVAILIDVWRLGLLVFATYWLTGSASAVLVAGTAYAITPLLVSYNLQLNPRGLGALFLDAMWLCLAGVWFREEVWLMAPGLLLAGLILITHKMTTQLFWFTAVAGAVWSQNAGLMVLIPASMLAAFVLSSGFYRKVLLAHVDIVRFWYRNWPWSGSNPVWESPVYGEPGYESPSKYYRSGLKAWIRRLQFVIGFNPWMPAVLVIALAATVMGFKLSPMETGVAGWLALTFAFGLLTTLVPAMRCLGQGYLYGYNGSFPAALLLGLTWLRFGDTIPWRMIVLATILACLVALSAYFRALRSSRTMKVDKALDQAMLRLKALPAGTVMCLPQHWHDVVAYRTGKSVAFGGHGYGFSRLKPFFPRLMIPVKDIISQYDIAYLLTYPDYLNPRFLADLPEADIESFGDYRIYRFKKTPALGGEPE